MGSGPSGDWCYHTADQRRVLKYPILAFTRIDLRSLSGSNDLGLVTAGQRLAAGVAPVEREAANPVLSALRCGCRGKSLESERVQLSVYPLDLKGSIRDD